MSSSAILPKAPFKLVTNARVTESFLVTASRNVLICKSFSFKDSKDNIKKFASKFKIPYNVAKAIWQKMIHAGINPMTIQNYSVLLTTYINLMDEKLPEVAPPGKEKMIKKLKKQYGVDSEIPFKIAWSQHNKEKG